MTVLVVDDTDTARDVVERILRFHGVNAFGARNGFEALSLLDQIHPDLVLLDVSMPEMDGLTVLARMREDPRWHDTPVVMMTAINDAESVGKAFRLGACEYLVKADFTVPKMLEVVQRHAHGD